MVHVNDAGQAARLARTVNKVLKVFYFAGLIGLLLVVGMLVLATLGPERFFAVERFRSGGFSLELNGLVRYELRSANLSDGMSLRSVFQSIAGAAIVYALVFVYVLRRLREVLDTVVMGEPFHRDNPKRIRDIGLGVTAAAFLVPAANSWVAHQMIQSFSLSGFSIVYSPDVQIIFTGLLLLVLAGVFAYGCYLQEEMDQTV
ncbi:MAG TPA: DUF2975 domain-containing protein [Firmicutes bacterium]|jgi:hypothetical protein|nr:DUF2975 domain-containing protein [Bacillota bacterium]HHT41848.1 DUF2975 domain-containing protein [Bacillota bacterium]